MGSAKQEALKLIDGLPEEATWEEILYHVCAKKKIASGIEAGDQDRVIPHEEVKTMFPRKMKLVGRPPHSC